MSKHDWSDLIYKVFFKRYDNPLEIQAWLEKMKREEGLDLVAFSQEYFVFKPEEGNK